MDECDTFCHVASFLFWAFLISPPLLVPTPNNLGKRAIFVSSFILVLGIVGLMWYIINFQNNLVEKYDLESAKLYYQA